MMRLNYGSKTIQHQGHGSILLVHLKCAVTACGVVHLRSQCVTRGDCTADRHRADRRPLNYWSASDTEAAHASASVDQYESVWAWVAAHHHGCKCV